MAELEEVLRSLPDGQAARGRAFERLCKWFLESDTIYTAELRKVWLWDDWPGRWGPDAGIDLVAEGVDGAIWAVQAKCYAPEYSITKADIDTFLSESSRAEISYRLMIATTDRLGPRARLTLDGQEKPAFFLGRTHLEERDFWPWSIADLTPVRPACPEPRRHQQDALDAIAARFRAGSDRVQVVMACGSGKTNVGAWASQALRADRTVVLVPSLSLLSQTLRAWTVTRSDFDFVVVCSDETTVNDDEFVGSASQLAVPVTTEVEEIASALAADRIRPLVVFATYHSSPRVAEALRATTPADLVVADEAHRCVAAGGAFATVLANDVFPAHRRLFMTATPRFFGQSVRSVARGADVRVFDMGDAEAFGEVAYTLSFGEAIALELLSDFQVVVAAASDKKVVSQIQSGTVFDIGAVGPTDARTAAAAVVLLDAMKKFGLRKAISFHSRVARAERFTRVISALRTSVSEAPEVFARHVSGMMPAGQRNASVRAFRRSPAVALLANARCLAEGVDIPEVDSVVFVDPRRSQLDVVQAVGRAIRKSEGKAIGTILVPVIVDTPDSADAAAAEADHAVVWSVLKALRAHDSSFAEELDAYRTAIGRGDVRPQLPRRLIVDLPSELDANFGASIEAILVEGAVSSWYFWFGLLQKFAQANGSAHLATSVVFDGWRLGEWAAKQRYLYARGQVEGRSQPPQRGERLESKQIDALESLPGWTWDPLGDAWASAYRVLWQFLASVGDLSSPPTEYEGLRFRRWVNAQREDYAAGRLLPDRVRQLQNVPGWVWTVRGVNWETNFALLEAEVRRTGSARVPLSLTVNDVKVGNWVRGQCIQHSRGTLTAERAARLESLPDWDWSRWPKQKEAREPTDKELEYQRKLDQRWDQAFEIVAEWLARNPGQEVPRDLVVDGVPVGQWIKDQRRLYKVGDLREDRVEALSKLDGWVWSIVDQRWQQVYMVLLDWVAREGAASGVRATTVTADGTKLGMWVMNQRRDRKDGSMRPDRAAKLESVPGWSWDRPVRVGKDRARVARRVPTSLRGS
jgi:superfamily II DNA or RNA helicase